MQYVIRSYKFHAPGGTGPFHSRCRFQNWSEVRRSNRIFQKAENKIRISEYRVDWWLWKEIGILDSWIIPLDRTELISLRVVLDNATCRGEEDATSVLVIDIEGFPKSFVCPLSTVASDRAIVCCLDDGCTARMYSAIVIER